MKSLFCSLPRVNPLVSHWGIAFLIYNAGVYSMKKKMRERGRERERARGDGVSVKRGGKNLIKMWEAKEK